EAPSEHHPAALGGQDHMAVDHRQVPGWTDSAENASVRPMGPSLAARSALCACCITSPEPSRYSTTPAAGLACAGTPLAVVPKAGAARRLRRPSTMATACSSLVSGMTIPKTLP